MDAPIREDFTGGMFIKLRDFTTAVDYSLQKGALST